MNLVSSPALRPSHPHGCRKRSFGQGHALSGRFAGLDRMPLLSGYGYLRATDEEASGGGSVKGSTRQKAQGSDAKKRLPSFTVFPHTVIPFVGCLPDAAVIPARRAPNTTPLHA